ncbi:MAG: hypothetical protein N3A01_01275 [Bacteroidales bacterium]|nr:hypothetical protein [Bacteroidales bacterium]
MKSISFIVLCISFFKLSAQLIIFENFDSYNANQKFVQQAGNPWTTWSNAPGSNEDPIVSSTQSYSNPNSVYIQNNNDLVLKLGGLTTGRYSISFKIFVENNKLGYFNILNSFAGNNSVWAFQGYFKNNGYFVIDAGAASADSITFTNNTWHTINIVVDLTDDIASITFNGQFFYAWKFSSGTFGNGNLKKLDGVNFYGWYEGGLNSGYYVDNVKVEQITAPEAPTNFTATLQPNNEDVLLTWSAPSIIPDAYVITKNNKILGVYANNQTQITDIHVYPNNYTYKLFSFTSTHGLSHPDSAIITVPGGVTRNLALFEIGTATWCTYCPSAAMAENTMTSNNDPVAIINYHVSDNYSNSDGNIRLSYYNLEGTPTAWCDGVLSMEGGSINQSLYPYYSQMFQQRIPIPSTHSINLIVTQQGLNQYEANITVIQNSNYFNSGLKLFTVLTESNINQNWQNQTKLHHVCRKIYPNGNGASLDFTSSNSQNFTFNISTSGFIANNCELVVFVQHIPSFEVTQTVKFSLSNATIIPNNNTELIDIVPTFTKDYIYIKNATNKQITVKDVIGNVLHATKATSNFYPIDLSKNKNGVYFINIENYNKSFKVILAK